ncbi:MAG: FMN-dependent NADH-azoreductase [Rubrivivax sp.]|nr:MAG: FMN-dependent NADH-azoreductase [Rubrivivax sp.]
MTAKLLVVETSPRGNASVSRQMTRRFVTQWRATHPEGEVMHRDLADTYLPHIDAAWLTAYFTPPERQTPDMRQSLAQSDVLVAELLAADHLVIGTPVYNYNVPASLKGWIDHIVRKGLTLGFDGKGLVKGKKATVLIASGGSYGEGSPIRERDIATLYLRLILGVVGIADVTFVAGGGAKAVDMGDVTMDSFVGNLAGAVERAAQG